MIAIVGGIGAALCFGVSTLCSAQSSRLIGSTSIVAWVLLVGLVATIPAVTISGVPEQLDAGMAWWLVLAGTAT
jgi:hypothetical protein